MHEPSYSRTMLELDERKKKYKPILIKNTLLSLAGYHIGIAISYIPLWLGVSGTQLPEISFFLLLIYPPHILIFYLIHKHKYYTRKFSNRMLLIQIILWLVIFYLWNFYLGTLRPVALIISFIAVNFLVLYANIRTAIIFSVTVAGIHLLNSYLATQLYHQQDSFIIEATFTVGFLLSSTLIAYHSKLVAKKLRHAATRDPLTRLYNRRHFTKLIHDEYLRCQRYHYTTSVMMIDLDFFKKVNDQFGHEMGDRLIIYFSTFLQMQLRNTDKAGRWGGEEFLVLLPHTNAMETQLLAERLKKTFSEQEFSIQPKIKPTFSAGISQLNDHNTYEEAIKEADQKLYKAKELGRNTIVA